MLFPDRTGKSGSNWLDRLRSNKGIPTGDNLDLDSFLLTIHSHSPKPRPHNPTRTRPSEIHDPPFSSLLAELFCMGATLTQTSRKCPRKQTNPKFFLAPSSATTVNPPATAAVAAAAEEAQAVDRRNEEENENDNENDDDGNELKGFTRSEVTVIDTSCPGWKVDKLVFRSNSVWKVREKKQKSKFFAKKKKKKSNETLDISGIGTPK